MINILLVDNRPDLIKRLKLKLLSRLEITAIAKDDIGEATEVLDSIPIQLMIGLDTFNEESKVISMLKVYMESKEKMTGIYLYQRSDTDGDIIAAIAERLGLEYDEAETGLDEYFNYHPVPIKNIQGLETPCNLFIKFGEEGQTQQFVKRVTAFDTVGDDLFAKLLSFSVDNVYIHKDDYDLFFTSLANNLNSKLLTDNIDERLKAQFESYQYITQYSNKLKFEKSVRDLAESTIKSVRDTILAQKELSELINKVVSHKDSLPFQTFYLTSLMSSFLLKKEANNDKLILQDIVFASLFCDLKIEQRHLFFVNSQEELEEAVLTKNITRDEMLLIQNHALENAKLLEDYLFVRPEVIEIVKSHHGSIQGQGFQDLPSSQLSALSKLFMTANTFIKYFLNPTYKFNKKQIVEKLTFRFANDSTLKKYTKYLAQKID